MSIDTPFVPLIVEVENAHQAQIAEEAGCEGLFFSLYARKQEFLPLKTIENIQKETSLPLLVSIQKDHTSEAQLLSHIPVSAIDIDRYPIHIDTHLSLWGEVSGFWQMIRLKEHNIHSFRSVKWDSPQSMISFFSGLKTTQSTIQKMSRKELIKEAQKQNVRLEYLSDIQSQVQKFEPHVSVWMSQFDPISVDLASSLGAKGIIIGKEVFETRIKTSENYTKRIQLSDEQSLKKIELLCQSHQQKNNMTALRQYQYLFEASNTPPKEY